MVHFIRTLFAGTALALSVAVPAHAAPATASVSDPAGDVPYSFSDQVDVTEVAIAWTDHLTVRITYAAAPPSARSRLLVSAAARDELETSTLECDPDAADTFTVSADEDGATLEDPSIQGSLSVPATWEGPTVTYTFASPTLTRKYNDDGRDPFVCVDGAAGEDDFAGTFDGKAAQLTGEVVVDGIRSSIERRFEVGYRSTTDVRCPARGAREPFAGDEYSEATPALRWCAYEAWLPGGAGIVFGGGAVYISSGSAKVMYPYAQRFPRGTRDCGTTDFSGKWLLAPYPANFGGAFMSVKAKRVPCRSARRIARRYGRSAGPYRCIVTKSGYEYRRSKCTASRGRVISIESGA